MNNIIEEEFLNYMSRCEKKGICIKQKKTCYNKIKGLGFPESFDGFTEEWFDNFTYFLIKKSFSKNYIGTFIKTLKAFMNNTYARGLHSNTEFKKLVKPREVVNHIYLTAAEIEKIKNLELPLHLELCRTIFLISYFTGARFSSVINFSYIAKIHFEPRNRAYFLQYRESKNGKLVSVPCCEYVRANIHNIKRITMQYYNRQLKVICKMAGITNIETYTITKGAEMTGISKPKYELVSSHVGRRSFATNILLETGDIYYVSKLLGHSSVSITEVYLKSTIEEMALERHINCKFFDQK